MMFKGIRGKNMMDEFYAENKKEIEFLENHMKSIESGEWIPKSFNRV